MWYPRYCLSSRALSGKTTLTQKICYDWATGVAFNQYDLILLAELRNARDDRYETILDVAQAAIRDNDLLNRIDYADKRILVLLDGYDEKREVVLLSYRYHFFTFVHGPSQGTNN